MQQTFVRGISECWWWTQQDNVVPQSQYVIQNCFSWSRRFSWYQHFLGGGECQHLVSISLTYTYIDCVPNFCRPLYLKENQCDKCAEAIAVDRIPFESVGRNDFSLPVQQVAVQPQCSFIQGGDKGVWYSVTTSDDTCLTISTRGSDISQLDTVLAVYKGECGNLTCIAQNDDWRVCGTCEKSSVTLNPQSSGENYKVLVVGKSGSNGNFSLSVSVRLQHFHFDNFVDFQLTLGSRISMSSAINVPMPFS